MVEQQIDLMFQKLPFSLKKEVLDYIEFLSHKYRLGKKAKTPKRKFKFDWEGGLACIEDNISAVDLQHKAMEWR